MIRVVRRERQWMTRKIEKTVKNQMPKPGKREKIMRMVREEEAVDDKEGREDGEKPNA
jgi:hypothetical protein